MATDATGTPTSLGIPTYNTSADAPSGLGFNAAMAIIDTLIAGRVQKPAGIASGEVAVWNGSGWDRSTVTKIGNSSLAGYPFTSNISVGTSLPGSPADGDKAILTDSTTVPTYAWLFQYVAGISDANKWIFIGGSPLAAEVAASEATTTTTTYQALTTAGPAVTVPRAGVYVVEYGAMVTLGASSSGAWMSFDIGATGAVDADGVEVSGAAGTIFALERRILKSGLAASTALTAKYRPSNAVANTFSRRRIEVIPVRVA